MELESNIISQLQNEIIKRNHQSKKKMDRQFKRMKYNFNTDSEFRKQFLNEHNYKKQLSLSALEIVYQHWFHSISSISCNCIASLYFQEQHTKNIDLFQLIIKKKIQNSYVSYFLQTDRIINIDNETFIKKCQLIFYELKGVCKLINISKLEQQILKNVIS
jgi:hypothetical protein